MGKDLSHKREPILVSSDLLSKIGFGNEKFGLYQSNNGSMNNDMNPKMELRGQSSDVTSASSKPYVIPDISMAT